MQAIKLSLVLLTLLFSEVAFGQGSLPSGRPVSATSSAESASVGSIQGRVVLPESTIAQSVKITVQSLRGTYLTVFTDNQGQFEMRNVPVGNYTLEVEGDKQQFAVTKEEVQVFKGAPSIVTITLRPKTPNQRGLSSSIVSAGELTTVPSRARKEFESASKEAAEGNTLKAIEHLRKAIEFHPNFMAAHNDLGAQYLELGELEKAAAEFRLAIALDKSAFNPCLNLGLALTRKQEYSEAAEILAKAISLDSSSPAARLYAGLAQVGLHDLQGAEMHFKAAHSLGGIRYAEALFYLGQVYLKQGERESAVKAFELYLKEVPAAANADQVQKLLGTLR